MCNKLEKNFLIALMIIVSGLSVFNGCIGTQTHIKGIEPYAHSFDADYEEIKDIETRVSSFRLLWFLPVTVLPDIQQAIDTEIIKAKGDNIINLRMWHERQYWAMGTVDVTTIQGKVIRYKETTEQDLLTKNDIDKKIAKSLKARVALEAIKGNKTTAEIAVEYNVHPDLVEKWKKQALSALLEKLGEGEDEKK